MRPKNTTELNNLGLLLLEGNCFATACKTFQEARDNNYRRRKHHENADATTTTTKRTLSSGQGQQHRQQQQRVYTAEAVPRASMWNINVLEFHADLVQTPSAKAFLQMLHAKSLPVFRMPPVAKSNDSNSNNNNTLVQSLTAVVVLYNGAMAHLAWASTHRLNTTKADEQRQSARQWLLQAHSKLHDYCQHLLLVQSSPAVSSPAQQRKRTLVWRTLFLLRLLVAVTLGRLDTTEDNKREYQQEIQNMQLAVAKCTGVFDDPQQQPQPQSTQQQQPQSTQQPQPQPPISTQQQQTPPPSKTGTHTRRITRQQQPSALPPTRRASSVPPRTLARSSTKSPSTHQLLDGPPQTHNNPKMDKTKTKATTTKAKTTTTTTPCAPRSPVKARSLSSILVRRDELSSYSSRKSTSTASTKSTTNSSTTSNTVPSNSNTQSTTTNLHKTDSRKKGLLRRFSSLRSLGQ